MSPLSEWEREEEEAVFRMKTDELDRLVAAGIIKEIDREHVGFIVRRIQPGPGQVTPYKFSGSVVAMGRYYAGLIVASAADLAGGGQRDGGRRQEAP
jgi:hypothetical protein